MICNLARSSLAGLSVAALAAAFTFGIEQAQARNSREATHEEIAPVPPAGTPLMAIVSLNDQRISIYDAQGRISRAPVSSGQTGYETPVGIYSVLQKNAEHYSNVYDDASMPFMQRLTWSGVALHAGELPGYPASHGCVRMPLNFAERLFGMTKLGMRVIVARNDVAPVAITHPLLWKPKPAHGDVAVATRPAFQEDGGDDASTAQQPDVSRWPGRQMQLDNLKALAEAKAVEAEAVSAKAEEVRRAARRANAERAKAIKAVRSADYIKRRADEKLAYAERALQSATANAIQKAEENKAEAEANAAAAQAKLDAAKIAEQTTTEAATRAGEDLKAADTAKDAAAAAVAEVERSMLPLSVFISLKTQRLYVRQGREPVLETAVTIRDVEQPIGTHIFTAVDYANDGDDVRWNVVSIGGKPSDVAEETSGERRNSNKEQGPEPVPTDVAAATAALDRVTIPQEAMDRISKFVWPGSSLIISDEEASKETGKATEFVVFISGEPQGGIKKRKRPPADPYYYYSDRYYGRRYRSGPIFGWW